VDRRRPWLLRSTIAGLAVLGWLAALPALAAGAAPVPATVLPAAWILVDADRGMVVDAGNPHQPLLVASAAKLMTALLAVERIPAGSTVLVDAVAASRPASRIGMSNGERWDRDQALLALLIVSANDAAYALGTAAAGSLAGYAQAATDEGRRLGLVDSTWLDPAGLDGPDGVGGGNHVSAFDLAILARAVLADPVLAPMVNLREAKFLGPNGQLHVLRQHNQLVGRYPGAVGVKTGYTSRAGYVLVAAATRDGRSLVAVTIGGNDLYNPATRLLDQGFATPASTQPTGEHLPPVHAEAAVDPASFAPAPAVSLDPAPSVAPPAAVTGTVDTTRSWPSVPGRLGASIGLTLGAAPLLAFGAKARTRRRLHRTGGLAVHLPTAAVVADEARSVAVH
jgi:D-alanyl-D-alanine carboxypeptidase (penicillin-binding protein 5/6)